MKQTIKNWLANWKTSSIGFTSIIGSLAKFYFAYQAHKLDEQVFMTCVGGVIIGIGFLAAGDASKSEKDVKAVDSKVDQTAKSVMTGDTSILPAPTPKDAPKPPGESG